MTESTGWRHDREHVRKLQHAHADHIEALYRGLAGRPGNPDGVDVRTCGRTRVFTVRTNRLENRAILTGNETSADLDEVFRYFAERGVRCVIEVNPANFYPSGPFSWTSELIPRLLAKGCTIEDFRCVWCCDRPPARVEQPRIERFGPERIEEFLGALEHVYTPEVWEKSVSNLRHGEAGEAWRHYIGYENDRPASTGTLFTNGDCGYLAWWFTKPDCRGRGHQTAGILQRATDAFDLGCHLAFTVTDFSIQSSLNLQRAGFGLAYNYLMLYREPLPLD